MDAEIKRIIAIAKATPVVGDSLRNAQQQESIKFASYSEGTSLTRRITRVVHSLRQAVLRVFTIVSVAIVTQRFGDIHRENQTCTICGA